MNKRQRRQRRIHLVLLLVWVTLIPPTILWWQNSIAWVVFMSLYAIIVSHWAAWEAATPDDQE